MSWTRLCGECARTRYVANMDGLHSHSGPEFEKWRRAMAASVGGILLDYLELDA